MWVFLSTAYIYCVSRLLAQTVLGKQAACAACFCLLKFAIITTVTFNKVEISDIKTNYINIYIPHPVFVFCFCYPHLRPSLQKYFILRVSSDAIIRDDVIIHSEHRELKDSSRNIIRPHNNFLKTRANGDNALRRHYYFIIKAGKVCRLRKIVYLCALLCRGGT